MRYLTSVLVLVLAVSSVFADDEFKSARAKRAKRDYDEEIEDAKKEYEKKVERAKKKYAKKLDEALKYETRKGNLEEAIKIKKVKEGLEDSNDKGDFAWLIGEWDYTWNNVTVTLTKDNVALWQNQNRKIWGKWELNKETNTIHITYENGVTDVWNINSKKMDFTMQDKPIRKKE